MFQLCSSLISLNISNFNTNNVQNMTSMFNNINKNCELLCNDIKLRKNLLNH